MTLKTADKTTRTIAGTRLTLQPGCRYWASRPMASTVRKCYPVDIWLIDADGFRVIEEPVFTTKGLSYDVANELINAFNNGKTSFEGRVW